MGHEESGESISTAVAQSITPQENIFGEARTIVNADCIIINKGEYRCPSYEKMREGGGLCSLLMRVSRWSRSVMIR
jgi:hypothetical protein